MSSWEWYIDHHYTNHCIICDKPIDDEQEMCLKHTFLFPFILYKAVFIALIKQLNGVRRDR